MCKPENTRQPHQGHRLIKSGGLALAFFCALNFSSLEAAVIKLAQTATGSGNLVANALIQSPADHHQGAVVANTAPATRPLTPIPEVSVLFPILGLVVAIALTQLLRRRRISQQRSSSPNGH